MMVISLRHLFLWRKNDLQPPILQDNEFQKRPSNTCQGEFDDDN